VLSDVRLTGQWREYYLPYLRRPQVEALLRSGVKVAVVPVGSIEQHAEHLPLGTDYYGVEEVCKAAAEEHPFIIVPAMMVGVSHHHLGFAGSVTVSPETLARTLVEVGESLSAHGFRHYVMVNGHGGNSGAVTTAESRLNDGGRVNAVAFPSMNQFYTMFLQEFAAYFDSHSGVEETSRALHAFPELVAMEFARAPELKLSEDQLDAIKNRDSDPDRYRELLTPLPPLDEISDTGALSLLDIGKEANAELGRRNFERFVAGLIELVKRLEGENQE